MKGNTDDLYFAYEQGLMATVEQHKQNICEFLREAMGDKPSDSDLIERAENIEEMARFLGVLSNDFADKNKVITVNYSQDLDYYEYKVPTYKEQYEDYTRDHAFSCKQYWGLLALALGDMELSSVEIAQKATEEDYKRVLVALGALYD